MDPFSSDPTQRQRLDPNTLPPGDSNVPFEDMPTRPMPIVGAAPPATPSAGPDTAPEGFPWDLPAPGSGAAPPPAANPYIPARPRPTPPEGQPATPRRPVAAPAPAPAEVAPSRPREAAAAAGVAPPHAARRGGALGMIVGVLLGLLVLVLAGAFALGGWYEGQYAGRMYPGVRVLGEELGGQTPAEARDTLTAKIDAFVKQPVVLTWQDKTWQPTPAQLGLAVNLDRTLDSAFRVGRGGDLLSNWRSWWQARQAGQIVPLVVSLDQAAIQTYLSTEIAPKIDQAKVEGEIWLQGEQIHTTEAKEGRQLRGYDALTAITTAISALATSNVPLPVSVSPPTVSAAEIADYNRQLSTWLSGPLVANAPGKQYTLDRHQLVAFVALARNADPAAPKHYDLHLRDDKLQALVTGWAGEIDHAAQNARFAWNGGHLQVLSESKEGYELPMTDTLTVVTGALNSPDKRTIALPVKTLASKVSSQDIDKLGIKQAIGKGNTTYQGSSEARATNIRVGAGFLNGQVVAPGDTFSILGAIAPIELNRGYVEGYVIVAERTEKGVGGGTCQVSTTAFRAAFWAGLKVVERNAHAYRVGVYEAKGEPVGFDAAVFDPGVDLKIVNNTPAYILFQTDTSNNELNVTIYGTPIADDIQFDGPHITNEVPPPPDVYQLDPTLPPGTKKQVETARKGLDVEINRTVLNGGQTILSDSFYSHFQAWPNWYLVAPDVQTPSPPRPPGR